MGLLSSLPTIFWSRKLVRDHHTYQENPYPATDPNELVDPGVERFKAIVALSDQADALLSDRPNRPAKTEAETQEILEKRKFNREWVDVAIKERSNVVWLDPSRFAKPRVA